MIIFIGSGSNLDFLQFSDYNSTHMESCPSGLRSRS